MVIAGGALYCFIGAVVGKADEDEDEDDEDDEAVGEGFAADDWDADWEDEA